jgi:hypothetical protein
MALPAAGQPISFGDINDELGNSTTATLDLKSASEDLGESTAPFGMDELAGLSDDGITFSAFAAAQGDAAGELDISWTLSTPSGVSFATNGFILKGSANSNMSSPATELQNSDGAGSPFTDTGLGNNTQRYYQATTTTTAGTVTNSSIVNATTLQAEVTRAIGSIFSFNVDNQVESIQKGWDTNELIECVENTIIPENDTAGFDPTQENINLSAFGGFVDGNTAQINGNQDFGEGDTGTDGLVVTDNSNFDGDGQFFRNNTDSKIHQIANNTGVISNTISYTPATLTLSLVSKDNNSVTVRATGNTQVAKTLRFYKDSTEVAVTNHTKGAVGNTSVTKDQTFSSLAANTSFAFKVRGENAEANGADSNTLNITTDADPITISPTSVAGDGTAGTELISTVVIVTIASPNSPTIHVDNNNSPTTKYKQATTSSGLSSASLVTPGVGSGNAQSLTLSGGNQVFLQFQVTTGELQLTNKTYTITNGSDTATISVTEVIR